MPSFPHSYDVVVIGGGPAGSTAATFLARQGHRCLILENTVFPRYHIGESLIPHTYGTLDRLGLLPKMKASAFPVKRSVRFVSPSGRHADPFYFSETIPGEEATTWQVERATFDQICLDHAQDNGVEVRMQTQVQSVLFDDSGQAIGVEAKSRGGQPKIISARVVIDASGRSTIIGSQLGLKTDVNGLDKAAVWTYFKGAKRWPGIDAGETTVFMIPERGWFWYIPLPDDKTSVGVVASPEYLFANDSDFENAYNREVKHCEPLQEMLVGATREGRIHGLRRMAYRNRQVAGNGWVMVGDAAAFLDPIYSSGLFLALASGELAAGCIHTGLTTNDLSAKVLGSFSGSLWNGIEVIRRLIHAFYDPEFSFGAFAERFPEQRAALIDCLVGNVVDKDMSKFLEALAKMTAVPEPA